MINHPDIKTLLGRSLVQKYLTGLMLRFADEHGITDLLSSLGRFSAEAAAEKLQQALGYRLHDRVRLRMVKVLMHLLCECGLIENRQGFYIWKGVEGSYAGLPEDEIRMAEEFFRGQLDFFEGCIAYADEFLKGGPPLYSFDNTTTKIWEEFLGNAEFDFARSVLATVMLSGRGEGCEVLDLCYGPGFDILRIQERFPAAKVTALDFKDIFREHALRRIPDPEAVQWIDSKLWDGFGTPLPFSDDTFDAVFLACADPYIPVECREFVYRDLFRILRSGGAVSILSHSYPDAEREYVSDPWVRKGALCHDFSESVCEGWCGFYDARVSIDLFRTIGYSVDTVMMNASIWRLDKP